MREKEERKKKEGYKVKNKEIKRRIKSKLKLLTIFVEASSITFKLFFSFILF